MNRIPSRCWVGLSGAALLAWAIAACGTPQEGGRTEPTPDVQDDREVLSPLIVDQPLNCGTSVTVRGYVPKATVEIELAGAVIGGGLAEHPDQETYPVPMLNTGEVLTVRQVVGGVPGPDVTVTVKDHNEVYPDGLPRPVFPALPLFDCGIATMVDSLPSGGELRVLSLDPTPGSAETVIGQRAGVTERQVLGVNPPFVAGHRVSAESQICTDVSPRSEWHTVQPAPATMPAPEIHSIWDEGEWVSVAGVVNGSRLRMTRGATTTVIGGAPAGHVKFKVSPPLSAGEVIVVTQELCGVESPGGSGTVQPCSSFPPVHMRAPREGDTTVKFIDPVPGARIQVFSGSAEIGDGSGSEVALIRPLVQGETIVAVQSLGNCIASTAHTVKVGEGLEDPSDPGRCNVLRWEYGQPSDPDRRTTDVTQYFNSPDSRVSAPMNAVPLHGVVRYPAGPGPFPIVLIVHGNHNPNELSYPGYDYLLDLFASHCFIAVSVEEDFLNGSVSGEMDARAIVLLRHLQLWREWTQTPGHPFFTKVDLSRVGLAGHSRGGEAVIVAEDYNASKDDPTDPEHDFGFGIRGTFAIAPVDGQHDLGRITQRGADYYVMHGSHDGDVASFPGHRAYDRAHPVDLATNDFKGLLYVHGADHAQWNTVWTPSGDPFPISPFSEKITPSDQQLLGQYYMTAFFLSSVKGWSEYNDFLGEEVDFSGVPTSMTKITQYQDPSRLFLNHYEEDDNEATGSIAGVSNSVEGTASPYDDILLRDSGPPHFLWGAGDGLVFGWNDGDRSNLVVELSTAQQDEIANFKRLGFRVGQTHEDPSDLNIPGANTDLTVQLRWGSFGEGPAVKVSDYVTLPYPMVTDAPPWGGGPKSVMQSVRIPWQDLYGTTAPAGSIEGQKPTHILLRFNEKPSGLVVVDEIQFTN